MNNHDTEIPGRQKKKPEECEECLEMRFGVKLYGNYDDRLCEDCAYLLMHLEEEIPESQTTTPSTGGAAPDIPTGSAGGSPATEFTPEPFTKAQWHAFELGRIAYHEGHMRVSPFEAVLFLKPLSQAWKAGWGYGQDRALEMGDG